MSADRNNIKIAAVVVTFNRLNLLQECIEALRNQTRKLDEIIVVNNFSTDGTLKWLTEQKDLTVITQENSGSAGGQYTGIKTAYEKGYDWIWCMDDDGYPDENCLVNLIQLVFKENPEVVSPIVIDKNDHSRLAFYSPILRDNSYLDSTQSVEEFLAYAKNRVIDGFGFFYNGVLVSRLVVAKVGLPIKELFIWGEEQEYFLRMKKHNIKMLVSSDALFFHPKSRLKTQKIIFNKYAYTGNIDQRYYYLFRNKGYISKKYFNFFDIKYVISQCLYYIFYKPLDFKSLMFFLKAFSQGVKLKIREK